jgi:hypothetical protein
MIDPRVEAMEAYYYLKKLGQSIIVAKVQCGKSAMW